MGIYDVDFTPYVGLADFLPTSVFTTLLHIQNKIVVVVTGNRFGKTRYISRWMTYRALGLCPVPAHNITPETKCRIIRIAAEVLPEKREGEVKNTVYPFIKSQLPSNLILDDITIRDTVLTYQPLLGGKPAQFEFVSYGQTNKRQAGVDRLAVVPDEVAPYEFYEESLPRLATTKGQYIVGMTPVEAGWMHSEFYERAKIYIRTPTIRTFLKKQFGQTVAQVEKTDSKKDICVIQAASDDNPVFDLLVKQGHADIKAGIISKSEFPFETVSEYLDSVFMFDDPDTIAMRRYGIFRQITGAVHKEFQWNVHVIEEGKYFPNGIPKDWKFARMIDYHMSVPWAIVWIALSTDDEAFVWEEMNPDPHDWTTLGICREMMKKSLEYNYRINLIDKLASEKQTITNTTTVEDMNRIFRESSCLGYEKSTAWEPWDDKTTKGEDKVRERLINSKICGRPLNNLQKIAGKEQRLPTLWISSNCKQTALSLKNWKMEEWIDRDAIITKDKKDKKESKWSHFNKCLEAIFKDSRFRANPYEYTSSHREEFMSMRYFQGRR